MRLAALVLAAAVGNSLGCARRHAAAKAPSASPAAEGRPQEEPLARARADFDEALARQTAGNWVGALALLRRVGEVRSTSQVRFNVALCEEFLGRLNAARGHYLQAVEDATREKAPEVAAEARRRLARLVERIPSVTVLRGALPGGAVVTLNGVELGDAALGLALPVDPGLHVVAATAPGYRPFQAALKVAERQRKTVEPVLVRTDAPAPTP